MSRIPELPNDLLWRVLPSLHGFLRALVGVEELSYQVDHLVGVRPLSADAALWDKKIATYRLPTNSGRLG
jgi:hypothetical protein